ncbi:MAG: tetratricopeptide repeat protein [Treponema sp.]|nr:tetratricopeptide repeat protein [Treponema sp.]
MKKILIVVLNVVMLFSFSSATRPEVSDGISLMDAIAESAERISSDLPAGSRVAIVAFESENDNLSDYIMEELTGELFDRGIEVADRQNLDFVFRELNFQMSGDVSDESAQRIGRFLAAELVITGQLIDLDSVLRLRTNAIHVETALRSSVARYDVRSDNATRRMITALANQQTTVRTARYGVSEQATPQTAGTFLDRGIMFSERGDYATAIADFTEAIRLNPNMDAAYTWRGMAYFYIDNWDLAIADYTQAIQLNQIDIVAYFGRGLSYLSRGRQGDLDNAITDLTHAIQLGPTFMSYFARSQAYSRKGDSDRAIADLSQVIRLDPNNIDAHIERGLAYELTNNMDNRDRAIADFTQALRLDPDNGLVYYFRGSSYLWRRRHGDLDNAIADFTQAIQIIPFVADFYLYRGLVFSYKEEFARAIEDFTRAIQLDPDNEDAQYFLESARQRSGRP